jgi:hypothetical protein
MKAVYRPTDRCVPAKGTHTIFPFRAAHLRQFKILERFFDLKIFFLSQKKITVPTHALSITPKSRSTPETECTHDEFSSQAFANHDIKRNRG